MILTKRLEKVLDLIVNAKTVADIGTDHAYLPISIIEKNKAHHVYAVDVNSMPLMRAKNNIKKFGYENQIFTILSNGLEFSKSDKIPTVDIVTISGLGAGTILSILENDNDKIKEFIICSNTDISTLRNWVIQKKYSIMFEDFFNDYGEKYWLIKICKIKSNTTLTDQEIEFGQAKYFRTNKLYKDHLKSNHQHLKTIINKIDSNIERIEELTQKINRLEEYLHEIN